MSGRPAWCSSGAGVGASQVLRRPEALGPGHGLGTACTTWEAAPSSCAHSVASLELMVSGGDF